MNKKYNNKKKESEVGGNHLMNLVKKGMPKKFAETKSRSEDSFERAETEEESDISLDLPLPEISDDEDARLENEEVNLLADLKTNLQTLVGKINKNNDYVIKSVFESSKIREKLPQKYKKMECMEMFKTLIAENATKETLKAIDLISPFIENIKKQMGYNETGTTQYNKNDNYYVPCLSNIKLIKFLKFAAEMIKKNNIRVAEAMINRCVSALFDNNKYLAKFSDILGEVDLIQFMVIVYLTCQVEDITLAETVISLLFNFSYEIELILTSEDYKIITGLLSFYEIEISPDSLGESVLDYSTNGIKNYIKIIFASSRIDKSSIDQLLIDNFHQKQSSSKPFLTVESLNRLMTLCGPLLEELKTDRNTKYNMNNYRPDIDTLFTATVKPARHIGNSNSEAMGQYMDENQAYVQALLTSSQIVKRTKNFVNISLEEYVSYFTKFLTKTKKPKEETCLAFNNIYKTQSEKIQYIISHLNEIDIIRFHMLMLDMMSQYRALDVSYYELIGYIFVYICPDPSKIPIINKKTIETQLKTHGITLPPQKSKNMFEDILNILYSYTNANLLSLLKYPSLEEIKIAKCDMDKDSDNIKLFDCHRKLRITLIENFIYQVKYNTNTINYQALFSTLYPEHAANAKEFLPEDIKYCCGNIDANLCFYIYDEKVATIQKDQSLLNYIYDIDISQQVPYEKRLFEHQKISIKIDNYFDKINPINLDSFEKDKFDTIFLLKNMRLTCFEFFVYWLMNTKNDAKPEEKNYNDILRLIQAKEQVYNYLKTNIFFMEFKTFICFLYLFNYPFLSYSLDTVLYVFMDHFFREFKTIDGSKYKNALEKISVFSINIKDPKYTKNFSESLDLLRSELVEKRMKGSLISLCGVEVASDPVLRDKLEMFDKLDMYIYENLVSQSDIIRNYDTCIYPVYSEKFLQILVNTNELYKKVYSMLGATDSMLKENLEELSSIFEGVYEDKISVLTDEEVSKFKISFFNTNFAKNEDSYYYITFTGIRLKYYLAFMYTNFKQLRYDLKVNVKNLFPLIGEDIKSMEYMKNYIDVIGYHGYLALLTYNKRVSYVDAVMMTIKILFPEYEISLNQEKIVYMQKKLEFNFFDHNKIYNTVNAHYEAMKSLLETQVACNKKADLNEVEYKTYRTFNYTDVHQSDPKKFHNHNEIFQTYLKKLIFIIKASVLSRKIKPASGDEQLSLYKSSIDKLYSYMLLAYSENQNNQLDIEFHKKQLDDILDESYVQNIKSRFFRRTKVSLSEKDEGNSNFSKIFSFTQISSLEFMNYIYYFTPNKAFDKGAKMNPEIQTYIKNYSHFFKYLRENGKNVDFICFIVYCRVVSYIAKFSFTDFMFNLIETEFKSITESPLATNEMNRIIKNINELNINKIQLWDKLPCVIKTEEILEKFRTNYNDYYFKTKANKIKLLLFKLGYKEAQIDSIVAKYQTIESKMFELITTEANDLFIVKTTLDKAMFEEILDKFEVLMEAFYDYREGLRQGINAKYPTLNPPTSFYDPHKYAVFVKKRLKLGQDESDNEDYDQNDNVNFEDLTSLRKKKKATKNKTGGAKTDKKKNATIKKNTTTASKRSGQSAEKRNDDGTKTTRSHKPTLPGSPTSNISVIKTMSKAEIAKCSFEYLNKKFNEKLKQNGTKNVHMVPIFVRYAPVIIGEKSFCHNTRANNTIKVVVDHENSIVKRFDSHVYLSLNKGNNLPGYFHTEYKKYLKSILDYFANRSMNLDAKSKKVSVIDELTENVDTVAITESLHFTNEFILCQTRTVSSLNNILIFCVPENFKRNFIPKFKKSLESMGVLIHIYEITTDKIFKKIKTNKSTSAEEKKTNNDGASRNGRTHKKQTNNSTKEKEDFENSYVLDNGASKAVNSGSSENPKSRITSSINQLGTLKKKASLETAKLSLSKSNMQSQQGKNQPTNSRNASDSNTGSKENPIFLKYTQLDIKYSTSENIPYFILNFDESVKNKLLNAFVGDFVVSKKGSEYFLHYKFSNKTIKTLKIKGTSSIGFRCEKHVEVFDTIANMVYFYCSHPIDK